MAITRYSINIIVLYVTLFYPCFSLKTDIALKNSSIKKLYDVITQVSKDVSCDKAMLNMLSNPKSPAFFPFMMYSAKGINDLGNYDDCSSTPNITRYINLDIRNLPISIAFGFCLPKECTPDALSGLKAPLAEIITKLANDMKGKSSVEMNVLPEDVMFIDPVEQRNKYGTYTFGFFVVTLIFVGFVVLSVLATVLNQSKNPNDSKKNAIVECFDLYKNWRILVKNPRKEEQELSIFDGIRAVAILWIIFAHVFWYAMYFPVINPQGIAEFIQEYRYAHVYNATLSVDVFFFLSSFLVTYILLKKSKGEAKFSFVVYIHRLIRLYPLVIMCLLFFMFILPAIGDSPYYYRIYEYVNIHCSVLWYKVLLFFANYRPYGYYCITYVWYVCLDFQLFLFSPIVIYLYCKKRFLGFIIPIILLAINIVYTVYIAYAYNIYASMSRFTPDYNTYYYERIYTRAGPYIIGILAGFLFYEHKSGRGDKSTKFFEFIKNSFIVRALLYAIGLLGMYLIIQALYWLNKYYDTIPRIVDLLYLLFCRDAFILSLFLFSLPVFSGKGRVVRFLLGNHFFFVLGKLSYGLYMVHAIMMDYYFNVKKRAIFYGYTNLAFTFWGYLVLAVVISSLSFVFIEQPIYNLEKLIFYRRGKDEKVKPLDEEQKNLVKIPIQNE